MASKPDTNDEPSMDEILASIRRVLNEDETVPNANSPDQTAAKPGVAPSGDDVFLLDQSMMTPTQTDTPAPPQTPAAPSGNSLVTPAAAAAASSSVGQLVRQLSERQNQNSRAGGTTVEDLVREALRPFLKDWLDKHLPPLVERLVRVEIERMVNRAIADN